VEIRPQNVENEQGTNAGFEELGENVNRILGGIGAAVVVAVLAGSGALLAHQTGKKSSGANAAAVARGKDLFQQKCSICHYATSDQKKIGPGLKGISKRGTFSVNGNKITGESLTTWIDNGDQLMPPFKDVLEPNQIKDIVAYVKTL